ncbi:MAG: DUF2059 domain-containing protein [Burkholderiaceae bacterium]
MTKPLLLAALLAAAPFAFVHSALAQSSPAKKELVQKLLTSQQAALEGLARGLVEQPAGQLMQAAGQALQAQVAPERREAVGKSIEADVRKYVDESTPLVRDRAIKLAPSTLGVAMEEKFSEDELKQLLAWFESPVNKKYQQLAPEMQNNFVQKLVADARPSVDPKLKALEQQVRSTLATAAAQGGASDAGASAPSAAAAPKRATPPARAASR